MAKKKKQKESKQEQIEQLVKQATEQIEFWRQRLWYYKGQLELLKEQEKEGK